MTASRALLVLLAIAWPILLVAAACSHDWDLEPREGGAPDASALRNAELVVPSKVRDVRDFIVTEDAIVWTEAPAGVVRTFRVDGGEPSDEPLTEADGLTADGPRIYFAGGHDRILRLPENAIVSVCGVRSIALDDKGDLFWVESKTCPEKGRVRSGSKTFETPGGRPKELHTFEASPDNLDVSGDLVAITVSEEDRVYVMSKDGGSVERIDASKPQGIAGAPNGFVWAESGQVVRYDTTASTKRSVVAVASAPSDVAVSAEAIYFVDRAAGTVERVLNDGTREVLVRGQDAPMKIVLAGSYVYWMTDGDAGRPGSIWRAPR